jgi:TIR domain
MARKTVVFISYNKADKMAANEIGVYLNIEGIKVKFDEWEITAGDSITQWMSKALQDCTHFIVLWSKNSAKSKWVKRELNSVLAKAIQKEDSLKVLPILLDNERLPSLLLDLQHIRYKNEPAEDRKNIIKAVTGQLPQEAYIKAIEKMRKNFLDNTPYGYICPTCGNINLRSETRSDPAAPGGLYEVVFCGICDWEDIVGC